MKNNQPKPSPAQQNQKLQVQTQLLESEILTTKGLAQQAIVNSARSRSKIQKIPLFDCKQER